MTPSRAVRTAADDCAAAVDATFGTVFATIDSWLGTIENALRTHPRAASVDSVTGAAVIPHLAAPNSIIIGAGFVAAPGLLVDAPWHLAWWLGHTNTFGIGSANPSVRRLNALEDDTSESFRDYTTLEWWRVPARTGRRHITGPYVDYLCTDDYTLTLTTPVTVDGAILGVVGADLYVNDIERLLLPHVRGIDGSATVVNGAGRVVVSTDTHRATGSILRPAESSALQSVPCGDTGLSILHSPGA